MKLDDDTFRHVGLVETVGESLVNLFWFLYRKLREA